MLYRYSFRNPVRYYFQTQSGLQNLTEVPVIFIILGIRTVRTGHAACMLSSLPRLFIPKVR